MTQAPTRLSGLGTAHRKVAAGSENLEKIGAKLDDERKPDAKYARTPFVLSKGPTHCRCRQTARLAERFQPGNNLSLSVLRDLSQKMTV